jgi:hypothetical protein
MTEWQKRLDEYQKNKEEWKDIPGYPPYQISNKKRVRIIKILKPQNRQIVVVKDGQRQNILVDFLYKLAFE